MLKRLIRDLVESDIALGLYGVLARFDISTVDVVVALGVVEVPPVVMHEVELTPTGDTLQLCFVLLGVAIDTGGDTQFVGFTFATAVT